jgi:hypothetical protein
VEGFFALSDLAAWSPRGSTPPLACPRSHFCQPYCRSLGKQRIIDVRVDFDELDWPAGLADPGKKCGAAFG